MLERTAYRIYPIINEICSKMVSIKDQSKHNHSSDEASDDSLDYKQINMKVLLGYLN